MCRGRGAAGARGPDVPRRERALLGSARRKGRGGGAGGDCGGEASEAVEEVEAVEAAAEAEAVEGEGGAPAEELAAGELEWVGGVPLLVFLALNGLRPARYACFPTPNLASHLAASDADGFTALHCAANLRLPRLAAALPPRAPLSTRAQAT